MLSTATSSSLYLTEQLLIPWASVSVHAHFWSKAFLFFPGFKAPFASQASERGPQVSTSIPMATLCCTWVLGDNLPGHPGSVPVPRPHKVTPVAQGCGSSQMPFTITDTIGPDSPAGLPENWAVSHFKYCLCIMF